MARTSCTARAAATRRAGAGAGAVARLTAPAAVVALALALALLLLAASPHVAHGQPPRERPMVVLVAVDGLRPEDVLEADRRGVKIPTLRRFVREGAHAAGVVGVVPTLTYPSHATLLTGVAPARHGILSNTTFDPLRRNADGWYWYASDLRAPTLWDAAAAAGLTTASLHFPVSVGAPVRWQVPQLWRTGTADDRKLVRALSTPGLLDTLEAALGPYADGIDESLAGDETRGRFAVAMLERLRPDLATFYFTALDHEQHEAGPGTPAAMAVLERIDALLGRIVEAAMRAGGGQAVVAVVSDHGFLPVTHEVHLNALLAAEGLLTVADTGSQTLDWRAAAWNAGGSAAIVLRDSGDAATRARLATLLGRLAADSASGVARVLDAGALAARGGFPGAAFLVELAPGYTTGGRLRGPAVTPSARRGMHGHLPDRPELRAAFLALGAGVAPGRALGVIDMRDVAPTLARVLGVALPTAEGRAHALGAASERRAPVPGPRPAAPPRPARRTPRTFRG